MNYELAYRPYLPRRGPDIQDHYGLTPPENCQPMWSEAMSHEDPVGAEQEALLDEEMFDACFRSKTPVAREIINGNIKVIHPL